MSNDFKILIDFLDQLGPEVSGREFSEPLGDEAAMLERFGRGELEEQERLEVCEMLRLHPAWIRWIADRVKMARPGISGGR